MTTVLNNHWKLCYCAGIYVLDTESVCANLFENVKNVQMWQKSACNCGPIITTAFDNRGFSSK